MKYFAKFKVKNEQQLDYVPVAGWDQQGDALIVILKDGSQVKACDRAGFVGVGFDDTPDPAACVAAAPGTVMYDTDESGERIDLSRPFPVVAWREFANGAMSAMVWDATEGYVVQASEMNGGEGLTEIRFGVPEGEISNRLEKWGNS